jgi:hypothetical protein
MQQKHSYTMTEKVYLYPSETANWHFVPVTKAIGQKIKARHAGQTAGFGSLKVEVSVGATKWNTSIFPDKYSGSYILPLKVSVRKAEEIEVGDTLTYTIKIV